MVLLALQDMEDFDLETFKATDEKFACCMVAPRKNVCYNTPYVVLRQTRRTNLRYAYWRNQRRL